MLSMLKEKNFKLISSDKTNNVIRHEGWPAISILMPTFTAGPEKRKNTIRFKNIIQNLDNSERLNGSEKSFVLPLLKKLLTERSFWQHLSQGLAIYISKDKFYVFHLPQQVKEYTGIGKKFYITPLLKGRKIQEQNSFYILMLGLRRSALLHCSPIALKDVTPRNFPTSIKEFTGSDEEIKSVQFRTGHSSLHGSGKRPALFHGHGASKSEEDENFKKFLRAINNSLLSSSLLEDSRLLLAGTSKIVAAYREINKKIDLFDEDLSVNWDKRDAEEFHQQALALVDDLRSREKEIMRNYYYKAKYSGKASSNDDVVLEGARAGLVEMLFVPSIDNNFVFFDKLRKENYLCVRERNRELVDLAVRHVEEKGGEICFLDESDMPVSGSLAAILRVNERRLFEGVVGADKMNAINS